MGCVGEQGSKQFSKFGRGSCYLHWTTLWVGVVRLIVLQSVLLLSFGCFDPLYFEGSVSTENILLCGDTYKQWDFFFLFFKKKRFLWSPFGVAYGFGRPTTTAAQYRCLRENLKEVTFSREAGKGRLSHSWDSAPRSAPQVNLCSRQSRENKRPGASRASLRLFLPTLPATERTNPSALFYVWSIFFLQDLKRPEQTDTSAKISCCKETDNNNGIRGGLIPPCRASARLA